jgi:hypothetical protein
VAGCPYAGSVTRQVRIAPNIESSELSLLPSLKFWIPLTKRSLGIVDHHPPEYATKPPCLRRLGDWHHFECDF